MKRFSSRIGAVVLALLIGLCAFWIFSYRPSRFQGGIAIRDSGFFSYPRYRAEIGELPLWEGGSHTFSVKGLPPGPLDFGFDIKGTNENDRALLTSLATSLDVLIADGSGKSICRASGRLSNSSSGNRSGWVLASYESRSEFWHSNCLELPISRFRTYTLTVRLTDVDPRAPHKSAVVVLKGGGIELP